MITKIQLNRVRRDLQFLEECIAGRPHSQKLLYEHFAPKMFGICLRYASDFHQAEDILQEGFIKVFHNLHRFRKEGSFEGWMKRIFINTAIEFYRKAANSYALPLAEEVLTTNCSGKALSDLRHQDLLKVIQQLPDGYRTVFNLYAIEGYHHKEIGQLLNISEGTSKSQLARARKVLKALIQQQEDEIKSGSVVAP
ncbi:MAG: sigma-70 family RNA polymerase sigma factor [Bacteroidota bacterium]